MYNKGHVYKILYENDNPVGNLTTDCCLKLTSRWLLSSCKNLYMRQTVVVNEEAKFSEKKKLLIDQICISVKNGDTTLHS